MKDALGDRMKDLESRTKTRLNKRTYTIIRLDGKAFHTFTKGFDRPYDTRLMDAMDYTTKMLCENIQGCKLGYVQSDEISLLLTDFENIGTDAYFDGNIQKIVSITASMASAYFNRFMLSNGITENLAFFDSRVFNISEAVEVENYFIWRQQDCVRNSISMTAQSLYSHKELNGVNSSKAQDMCMEKGVNWNDQPDGFKRGRMITKENYEVFVQNSQKNTFVINGQPVSRTRWAINPAIWITQDRDGFSKLVPRMEKTFTKIEIEQLLIDCKNRFGGSELQDYTSDEEVQKWFRDSI